MASSAEDPPALPSGYKIEPGFPPVATYRHLREASGLSPVTEAQAKPIAAGSWYGCYVTFTDDAGETSIAAMGRILGDGGWYFTIADMAVLPEHQRKGLGDAVLKHLLAFIKANAPEGDPYVNLLADPPGRKLYEKNGFVDTMPRSLGMRTPKGWRFS
ncbi:putative GNAT family N-acetyltransferase [Thozetella sp. PMI_491]|nr:putative GNAT family N-acetyltransferase [Thozetella sp. PMI_491]